MTIIKNSNARMNAYMYFSRAWDHDSAYSLALYHYPEHWTDRLYAAIWLTTRRIPLTGEAPSMGFKGFK